MNLVALDAHLHLRSDVLYPLAKVAGDLIRDARIEMNLDLAPALADGLGIVRLEKLGRKLASGSFLSQDLQSRLGALLTCGVDQYQLVLAVERSLCVLEVVTRAHLSASLVERVGQLSRVELRGDVERELSHPNARWR